MVDKRIFPAKLDQLYSMLLWIRELALPFCTTIQLKEIELACEEALVNIIHYAYKGNEGDIELEFNQQDRKKIQITIKDRGSFFNPLLEERKIDLSASLQERPEGGLGIMMIRKYMDEIHYKRINSSNVLMLVKNLY